MAKNPTMTQALTTTGLDHNWMFGSYGRSIVPALDGIAGLETLSQMWETDETMGSMAWVIESTLSQVEWLHTPCKDGKEAKDDPEAIRYATFMDQCLDDMDHSWGDHVEEALTMIPFGFAPCEIVMKQRRPENSRYPDEFYGFKRLPLRDQLTVSDWKYSPGDRDILSMQQYGQIGGGETPMWKLLHYRTRSQLNNPWGKSLLRPAYRPWYLKRKIQDTEAIGIDRELAGMPTFYIPKKDIDDAGQLDAQGQPTPSALAAQRRIQSSIAAVRDLRFNDAAGLVIPSDVFMDDQGKPGTVRQYEFKLVTSSGQRAIDARSAIRDYDRAISRVLLFQFLHLGDRSGGSYALSDNQSDLALRSLRALSLLVSREYNAKAVPLVFLLNGWDRRYMPRLEPSPIAEDSLEQIGLFLDRIAGAEPLFTDRPDLLEAVLSRAGLRQARLRQANPAEVKRDVKTVRDVVARTSGGTDGG